MPQSRAATPPSGLAASAFNAAQLAAAAAAAQQQKRQRLEGASARSPRPPFVQAYTPMLSPGYGASQVCPVSSPEPNAQILASGFDCPNATMRSQQLYVRMRCSPAAVAAGVLHESNTWTYQFLTFCVAKLWERPPSAPQQSTTALSHLRPPHPGLCSVP